MREGGSGKRRSVKRRSEKGREGGSGKSRSAKSRSEKGWLLQGGNDNPSARQGRSVKGRVGKGGMAKGLSGTEGGTYFEPSKVRSKYYPPLASSLSTVARRKKAGQARTVDEHLGSKY